MAKNPTKPTIAQRTVDEEGFVYTFDQNERHCWDIQSRERVVLVKDLRRNGPHLHMGQLGWTLPESTDGYKEIDVIFDTGQRLRVFTYALRRVLKEKSAAISEAIKSQYRNTRFDADPAVAEMCRIKWASDMYGEFLSLDEMCVAGEGDEEVYAYTYPSLRELAAHRGEELYPVKIGYTRDCDAGSLGRIRQQIVEKASYPEKPILLLVQLTWDGRKLETLIHQSLRKLERRSVASLGKEWYNTSKEELLSTLKECPAPPLQQGRAAKGADETLEDGFGDILSRGGSIEFSMDGACVRMSIKDPEDEKQG